MTEAEFTLQVAALAQRMGLLVHWCPDSRRCIGDRGFFDLVVIGTNGVIFAENKMPDGEPSADQDRWAWTAHQIGSDGLYTYVRTYGPADLESGQIERDFEMIASTN
jgi:hypothetical protein